MILLARRPDVRDRDGRHRPLDRRDPGLLGRRRRAHDAQPVGHEGADRRADLPARRLGRAARHRRLPARRARLGHLQRVHRRQAEDAAVHRHARHARHHLRRGRPALGRHQPLVRPDELPGPHRERQAARHLRARADRGDRRADRLGHAALHALRPLHVGRRLERGGGAARRHQDRSPPDQGVRAERPAVPGSRA